MAPAFRWKLFAVVALFGVVSNACTAPKPSISLKLIGLLMPAHDGGPKIAVFQDSVGHVVGGREGDFIEGRYRITRIMTDAVEIEITDNARRKITVTVYP